MELINKGTARICGIAPGERGERDPQNPSVAAALAAGLLVSAEVERQKLLVEAGVRVVDTPAPSASREVEALRVEMAELGARLERAEGQLAERDATIAELRAELDEALRAATASAGDPPKPGRTRREG